MKTACAAAVLALVLVPVVACGDASEDPSAESEDALVRGRVVPPGELRAIVELGDDQESFCTAAKVGDRVLLTAAHCVVAEPAAREPGCIRAPQAEAGDDVPTNCDLTDRWQTGKLRVRVRGPNADRWVTVPVTGIYMPKSVIEGCRRNNCFWDMAGHQGVPDIAVIQLGADVPTALTAPVDLNKVEPQTPIVVAGYGCTRSGDRWIGDGQLRADASETVALSSIPQREVSDLEAAQRPAIEGTYFFSPASAVHQSSLCPGDSGGALFAPSGAVIGVNAYYVSAAHGTTMRANMFTRLDPGARPEITQWLRRRLTGAQFL